MGEERAVVMITGCSEGGIGNALARAFAERDCFVVATARSVESMANLEGDSRFLLLELDVLSEISVINAVAASLDMFGRIDVLVNNAGVHCVAPLAEIPMSSLENVFNTNVYGPLRVIQAVVPHMAKQKKGWIVNIGSIAGLVSGPWAGGYSASKASLHAVTDSLRLELKPLGIGVTLVAPGSVSSNFGFSSLAMYKRMPEWKLYKHFEAAIRMRTGYSQGPRSTPPDRFARKVTAAVLKQRPPAYFTYGHLSGLVNTLYYMPTFIKDFVFRVAMKLPLQ
ncbi:short-chain dehydrogenase RED1-like [Wolffia australiana]